MTAFPLRHAVGNVLFGRGDARAALFRVETVSYPFLPEADKLRWLGRLARLAYAAEADFSLWRVCRAYPADRYVERAAGMLDARHQDPEAWRAYLRGHEAHLRALGAFEPEVYLAVALPGARRARRWRAPSRPGAIAGAEVATLQAQEERALRRAEDSGLRVRRATTRELQWLLRRAACRGVAEPRIDDYWSPPAVEVRGPDGAHSYAPLETSVSRHANAPVREEGRALVVDGEEATSHQAMLALGAPPLEAEFPGGAELLFGPLEWVSFPVDAVVHVRWEDNRAALGKVRRKVVDADNAYADQASSTHGALSWGVEENRAMARDLLAELEAPEHPPLLVANVGLAVGAPTRGALEERVEALRGQYGPVMLHRPVGLQAKMFMDHLPRADAGAFREYDDRLTVTQFGALMPVGTHQAGSARGAYVARTVHGGRRPVRFDVTEAAAAGRPPSILLAGTLGSGKTIAAQLLAFQAERRGSLVVDVDPKPDHNLEGLPELAGRVRVVELEDTERYRGELDPLRIAPPGMREDLGSAYLIGLLPQAPPTWETQVRKAVRAALSLPDPCLAAVLGILDLSDNPDARAAGDALGVWAESSLGRLAFGQPEGGVARAAAPVTTIKARGLALPAPGTPRGDWDQSERMGVATLKLVAAYAMRLVTGDRSAHKVLLFDEAWFLLASQDGRRLIDRLNRQGRTENVTLLLATQQLSDVGEIENLIGTRFIFGQETAAEARRALELLGLDPADRGLVDRVRGYRAGRCLLRDVDDRVAEVQVDPASDEFLRVLDTSPGRRPVATTFGGGDV